MPRRNKNQRGTGPRGGRGKGGHPHPPGINPVTAPLTPKQIGRQTRAATNQKFRPLERAEGADLRASERRVREEGDWWQNYLNQVSAGQADTSAAYAQAGAADQANLVQASQLDSANTQRLQGEADQSAALRGVAPDMAGSQREAAAQAQRNYLGVAQSHALGAQGAAQRAYLNQAKNIGVGQSIASRNEERRRGLSIRKDRRDTRRERGDYAATKRQELRDKEFEKEVQGKAFGLDKAKLAGEAAEGQREAGENALERAEKQRQQSIENRQKNREIRQEQEKIDKEGGKSQSERNASKEGRRNAAATAQSLYERGAKGGREWPSWAALERAVAKESEVSPVEARQAVAKLRKRVESESSGTGPAQGHVHR